ncbi:MAG: hypothetical protein BAA01_01110 [Bacillus thermozeamaize]|uniref:Uncharacterized protein n=1 Tax=Bacillus thermozeamaize TaxID=230954 RepID=A0A1Y3PM52_9BACI|nr:MAG: hypothetical protein BAA01_01110 [Bacillus thermozeamaize]
MIELRLRNVCTMEEANRVLPELIDKHNRLFAVAPQEAEPAYRPLPEVGHQARSLFLQNNKPDIFSEA